MIGKISKSQVTQELVPQGGLSSDSGTTKIDQTENIQQISNLTLAQRLQTHVVELCKIPRNTLNHEGMEQAAQYIKNSWNEIGLGDKVEEQVFEATGTPFHPKHQSKNIIVSLGPKDGERVVIGAHYDTCAQGDPKEITNPGADDNASAVAGLLETGRELKNIEKELFKKGIRVDLVAYANEEPPYFKTPNMGSYVHAKSLKESGAKVKGMICYEMIGYYDDKEGSQGYLDRAYEFHGGKLPWYLKPINWTLKSLYPSKGNFISVVGNWNSRALAKKLKNDINDNSKMEAVSIRSPAKVLPLIEMSDQWSYWEHGFPAVMLTDTAFLRNSNYHKNTDTPDTLNYSKMAELIKGVTSSIVN